MCDLPELMTVEETARYLGIGRTKAYAMARQWRTTGGRLGIPAVEIGSALRISRPRLEQLIAAAIASSTPSTSSAALSLPKGLSERSTPRPPQESRATSTTTTSGRRRRRARPSSQSDLFDGPTSQASSGN